MEKRLNTNTFSMRFATSIHAMIFVDAFFAHKYLNDPSADFKPAMERLAYRLMHNPDAPVRNKSPPVVGRSKPRFMGSPSSEDGLPHNLCALRHLPGFVGHRQQRCVICDKKTSWCCATCSVAPSDLVPLCPAVSQRDNTHDCSAQHRDAPLWFPHGKGRNNFGGAKRRRTGKAAPPHPTDDCLACDSSDPEEMDD